MFFFNGLASAIFRAVTGRLCDIKRNIPIWIMRLTVLVSGTLVILMTLLSSYEQLLACFVVYGMTDGAFASSMNISVLSTLSMKQKSQGIGFFHLCIAITLVAGPPFGGTLFVHFPGMRQVGRKWKQGNTHTLVLSECNPRSIDRSIDQ